VVAVMDQGKVVQEGSPTDIYDQPANRYVADFIGDTNFLECKVLRNDGGMATIVVGDKLELQAACDEGVVAGAVGSLIVRPERVQVHAHEVSATEQTTVVAGVVLEKTWIGTDTNFLVRLADGSQLRARHQNMVLGDPVVQLDIHDQLYLSWQREAARFLTS